MEEAAAKVAEDTGEQESVAVAEATSEPGNHVSTKGRDEAQDDDNEATEDEEEDEEDDRMDVDNHRDEVKADGTGSSEQNRVETEPVDKVTTEPSEEDLAKQAEASYSTRGRSGETALDILAESSHRESEVNLPREKEHAPTAGPSFLSDSLTEEERRTRTRYLPNVEGIHALRKQEIKGDLALARSMTTSVGVASTLAKKIRRAREDDMDVDETVAPSDDDKASEILRVGSKSIVFGGVEYQIPCPAFIAPNGVAPSSDSAAKGTSNPPTVVVSVTAFNPPRPPESVGPKKKHRMLRWERRPADIEVDLTTNRKTVQKTREELMKAMEERPD